MNDNIDLSILLCERGLIPKSLINLKNPLLEKHIDKIIEHELNLFFEIKRLESLKLLHDTHLDDDLKNGRVKFVEDKHPTHMYS